MYGYPKAAAVIIRTMALRDTALILLEINEPRNYYERSWHRLCIELVLFLFYILLMERYHDYGLEYQIIEAFWDVPRINKEGK